MTHTTRLLTRFGSFNTLAIFGLLSALPAAAQVTYTYTGNGFTLFSCGPNDDNTATHDCATPAPANTFTSYTTSDHVTATISLDSALPTSMDITDIRTLPGFHMTLNDGHQTSESDALSGGMFAEIATDGAGNIIQWRLVRNLGNAANSGVATINKGASVFDQGTLACCDPTVSGDLGINFNVPGSWSAPGGATPAQKTSALLTAVTGMNIPAQGASLVNQLEGVLADITAGNGLACNDLTAFSNHVRAQTGKKITGGQATQIQSAVADIRQSLNCP